MNIGLQTRRPELNSAETWRLRRLFQVLFGLCVLTEVRAATIRVPQDQPTVRAAMNAAQPGDVVLLSAGHYNEAVTSVRGGAPDARIVLDGQGQATIRQFIFRHPWITVQNLQITGVTQAYSYLVYFDRGGHFGVLSNCVVDAGLSPRVYGISWNSPRTKPFGEGEAASFCLVISNELRNVLGITMVNVMGDSNRVVGNVIRDGGMVDFLRLFGRHHYIAYNVFSNAYYVEGEGNHPDFVQTFGNNGDGSWGHIIEGNVVRDSYVQVMQLEATGCTNIGGWSFRNNVFINISMGGNCYIPDVTFYNNLFYQCNTTNKSHVLWFRTRSYDTTYYGVPATDMAHGCKVLNNVFLDCGGMDRMDVGWYAFATTNLINVAADYNYVSKRGFSPVPVDGMQRSIGDPRGWNIYGTTWWEAHGINGGDPGFMDVERLDFRLQEGSRLIGRGLNLSALFTTDIQGWRRCNEWDVGPYALRPCPDTRQIPPPGNLRIAH